MAGYSSKTIYCCPDSYEKYFCNFLLECKNSIMSFATPRAPVQLIDDIVITGTRANGRAVEKHTKQQQ